MSFPTQPEELSTDWLSQVLGRSVSKFEVERFGEGAGIIGQVTRVHYTDDNGDGTLIAKFASPAEENRAVAATYSMYEREVSFFTNFSDRVAIRTPECYHAEFDATTQFFIILMEDIGDMRIGDQVAGCSEAEAALLVQRLAEFHASTWDQELDLTSHNNPAQRDGMMGGFGVGWPVVCEQFPEFIPEDGARLGEAIPAAVPKLLELMTVAPVSMCHADVRLDNVFFSDDDIALVDWQSVCTSAPEQDLAYFVTQSLSTEVRNARDWVAVYHQALQALGISNYPLDACRQRFRVCALYLCCYATIIAGTLDLGNERGQALGRTLFGNAMTSLQELDAFALLDEL